MTDYYNDPANSDDITPYVRASLRYTYTIDSFAEIGVNFDRTPTDVLA